MANKINKKNPVAISKINPYNGELINLSGTSHLVVNKTLDQAGGYHFNIHQTLQLKGTGNQGNEYVANWNFKTTDNDTSNTIEVTKVTNIPVISKGKLLHFLFNPLFIYLKSL